MNFRQLEKKRPSFAHHPLLNVEVGELFERTYFFGSELGDALIYCNGFGKEPIADENLRQALKIIDGLKGFTLADIELADGHQSDLVARLEFQNILVFGDGLDDLALVQQLLCGFDVFAFVISHARTRTNLPLEFARDILLGLLRYLDWPQRYSVTLTGGKKPSQRTRNLL